MNNRKTPVNFQSFTVSPRTEHSKDFSTMFEILNDAEKYHEAGEHETCKSVFNILKHHIDKYGAEYLDKESLVKPEFPKDRPNTSSTLQDFYNKAQQTNPYWAFIESKGYNSETLKNINVYEHIKLQEEYLYNRLLSNEK